MLKIVPKKSVKNNQKGKDSNCKLTCTTVKIHWTRVHVWNQIVKKMCRMSNEPIRTLSFEIRKNPITNSEASMRRQLNMTNLDNNKMVLNDLKNTKLWTLKHPTNRNHKIVCVTDQNTTTELQPQLGDHTNNNNNKFVARGKAYQTNQRTNWIMRTPKIWNS